MSLPPAGLSGLDARWSREVTAPDSTGVVRTWHVLDSHAGLPEGAPEPIGTLLCVHGNPSWSYLWRRLVAQPPAGWRVIAIDHLDMGFSQRTGTVRPLAQRVDDLDSLTDALGLTGPGNSGPIISVAHDWGGPISLGWALRHLDQMAGVVLSNTAVHQPANASAPTVIRAARLPGMLPAVTSRTRTFIRAGLFMSRPVPPPEIRAGYYAPYSEAGRRDAIEDFVADIPLDPDDVSAAPLDAIAAGLGALADVPVLLLWGPRDPVFSDLYLRDLIARLPHADVHRYEGSSHFVPEDAPTFAADLATVGPQPEPPGRSGCRCRGRAGRSLGARHRAAAVGGDLRAGCRSDHERDSGRHRARAERGHGLPELRRAGRPGHPRGRRARGDRRPTRGADRPAGPSRHRPDRRPLRDLARPASSPWSWTRGSGSGACGSPFAARARRT